MAHGKKNEHNLTPEEKIARALVPDWEQPYKVPKNWYWTTLEYAAKFIRGSSPRPIKAYQTESEDGVNWIKIGDTDSGKYINSVKEKITKQGALKSVPVHKGDLLLTNSMSYGKPFILNVDGYIHDGWFALVPSSFIDKEFLYYSCLASEWYFDKIAVGTAVRNISTERTATTPIAIPPMCEQRRIVECIEFLFAKLDEAKEKAQSVLDNFEIRKAAILHKALIGELTVKWRMQHRVTMDTWKSAALGDFLYPMQTKKPCGKTFRYIDIDAIDNRTQTVREAKVLAVKDAPSRASRAVNSGAVLFSMVRPYLKNIALIDSTLEDCIASTGFYVCRSKEELDSQYLYHLLCSKDAIDYLMQFMKGDNSPSIRRDDLLEMPVSIPSIPEQNEIVRILENLFSKELQAKAISETLLEQIDLLKKSIITRAFRGELGTNDPSEESALALLKEILETEASEVPKKRGKSIPKDLQVKLETEIERKILRLYFQRETDSLPAEVLLSVSSKKFDVLEALHNLEHRGLIKKLYNGNYRLLG